MGLLVKKPKPKPLSLKEFSQKKKKVLIWHDKGGLGDVLMQRMMLEDFKAFLPDTELVFACLPEYIDAAKDHHCISEVIDSRTVNPEDYCAHYNTCVTIADRYENRTAPFCTEHRSDIWAKYCGVELKNHNMRFNINPLVVERCKENMLSLCKNKDKPIIVFSPISKMKVKTLLPWQIEIITEATKEYNLIGLHKEKILELNAPTINKIPLIDWMGYIAAADYVISVDTAAFHMAGGLKKPLMGIFTFADGKVYGKHFDFVLVQKHRDNGNWDCGPCFKYSACPKCSKGLKPCLTELTKEEILCGISDMFLKWPFGKNRISLC